MAKDKGCSVRQISFKTKSGKTIKFKGRPAGVGRSTVGRKIALAKYGATCDKNSEREAALRRFKAIAKNCGRSAKGKGKQKFRSVAACTKREWAA